MYRSPYNKWAWRMLDRSVQHDIRKNLFRAWVYDKLFDAFRFLGI